MTNNATIVIGIALVIYLVGIGTFLNFYGQDIHINYTTTNTSIQTGLTSHTVFENIANGVNDLPSWLNYILITIPVGLLIAIGILLFLHG